MWELGSFTMPWPPILKGYCPKPCQCQICGINHFVKTCPWQCIAQLNTNSKCIGKSNRVQIYRQAINFNIELPLGHRFKSKCSTEWSSLDFNKRPKGPHNVHLSTMCHLFWRIGQGGHFYLLFGPKNTNLMIEDVEILFPIKSRWIPFCGVGGKVEICLNQQRPRRPSCFFKISPKNTNLVESIEILLPVKFRWISAVS